MTNATADIAWTATIEKTPDAEGRYFSLGMATRDVPGYAPIKETGAPEDPLYVAKGPTRFKTYDEASAEARRRNITELGLTDREAMQIVASSFFKQGSRRRYA